MPPFDSSIGSDPQYERFSDIYDIWTQTAPSAEANLSFYRDLYLGADGPVVELGVGDGRIAIEAAKRGCSVTGVDASPAMLRRCAERAECEGVADHLQLIEGDFRTFQLDQPAALITLPYHSLGHLATFDEKRHAISRVHQQLRPGGRFVFDDFMMTKARRDYMRQAQLRAVYQSPQGAERLLWVTSLIDESLQQIRVVTWEDELDANGELMRRQYRQLALSWLTPHQARTLLTETGFVVDACWGDFKRTPFDATTADEQIWSVHRST